MSFVTQLTFTSEEQHKLRQLGIRAVILFGSRAQGINHPTSDYDVFIVGRRSSEAYDFLYDTLSKKIQLLVNIDIVFQSAAPMELQNHVAQYGQILFQENTAIFVDFKSYVMETYADFEPLRRMFQQATLERIAA
jgi:predicted nucleotidyltransferase